MDPIKAAAEALQSTQRRCKIMRAVNMAIYAASVVMFFLQPMRPAALVLIAIGLLLHFLVVRQMTEAYKTEAEQANLRFGLCGRFTDFTYSAKGGMGYDDFCAWGLAPIREEQRSLLCRSGFTARDGSLFLTGQETTFHYDNPNSQGKKSVRFLSGTLFTAGAPGNSGWLFLRPDVLSESAAADFLLCRGYAAASGAPKGWALYGQKEAPDLSEDLLHCAESLEQSVSILRLTEQGAAAFLNSRFYVGARYPSTQPTDQLLQENTFAERDSLMVLFRQWLE